MSNAACFVGDIPQRYDQNLGPYIFEHYADVTASLAAARLPTNVLETAAGTGIVTRALRDRLPAGAALMATDLNEPMLAVARKKFAPEENVGFQTADALDLPFPAGAFDLVVCQFGAMFFPDKTKSYNEARRVLAPGGTYLFSVWDSQRYNPFARIAHEVIGGFFSSDPPPFYAVPFSYCRIDEIKESLLDAGFGDIEISVSRREQEVADAAAFARGLVYGNPAIDQIRERGSAEPERIVETLAQALRREFGGDRGKMPLQAILILGRNV